MISASKSTLGRNNLKILRPKVTKNLTNLEKKFCESPHDGAVRFRKDPRKEFFQQTLVLYRSYGFSENAIRNVFRFQLMSSESFRLGPP